MSSLSTAGRPLPRRLVGRVLALALLALALAAAVPAAASAWQAGVIAPGTRMTFDAEPLEQNRLTITRAPNGTLTITDPAGEGTAIGGTENCQNQGSNTVVCTTPKVVELIITLDDGDDTATVPVPQRVEINGGPGNDTGTSGSGNDLLAGGDGNDTLDGGTGADLMRGAEGRDAGSYETRTAAVEVTLDALANDGEPGEGDLLEGVEDVRTGAGDDTIVGDVVANALDAGGGQDYIDGGAGADAPSGGGDRDTIRTRDDQPEPVSCGPERDYAIVDPADAVNPDCELFDRGVDNRPVLARSAVVQPSGPALRMLLTGTRRFVPLLDRINLPFGWRIDSAAGPVNVTAARGRRGRQSGTFVGAEFALLQARARRPVTELRLSGGNFGICARARRAVSRTAHTAQRRRVRRLFGRARGRFRSRGRFSSATVRGTRWSVEDRCDGTLTRVQQGRIDVRDFVRRRTVRLRAGQRYLARARRR